MTKIALESRLQIQQVRGALETERHLRQLFDQAPGFVCILSGPEHLIELTNRAYCQLVEHREVLGKPVREALPELDGHEFFELLDHVYATGEAFSSGAIPMLIQPHPQAALVEAHIDFVYQPIVDDAGDVTGIFMQGSDVSTTHQPHHQSTHDTLTGLINRHEFERHLRQTLLNTRQSETEHTLLYFVIDQFKVVNDTCSHAAGDALLQYLSKRLRSWVRSSDVLAHLEGDKFGLLLTDCEDLPAQRRAEELHRLIGDIEFSWGQLRYRLAASIGVVTFGDSFTPNKLLSAADLACFLAREKGRNRVHVYRQDDEETSARLCEMNWVGRLQKALQDERLVLFVQRIVPITGRHAMEWGEVLLRLRDEDGSIVPPMAFLPAAERYNLMPAIDRYVVQAAFRHFDQLPEATRRRTAYSINLSGATLDDKEFLQFVEEQLARHRVPPSQICFEITETVAVANLTQTAQLIRSLQALGFNFALDDFGSGMSSFGYLKHLPINYLKVDGEFVKGILEDAVNCAMVEAIAKVAGVMGIKTIAEFVESQAELDLLDSIGVDFAQGFGVHKPEPLLAGSVETLQGV
ncbi:hypothetical protein GCM10027040_19030 [Halomonas shantousis]